MQKVLFEWWKPTLYLLHLPRVKSGISTAAPPSVIDFSDRGVITIQVAVSYVSIGGTSPLLSASK